MAAVPGSADLEGILSRGMTGAPHQDAGQRQVDARPGPTQRDLLDPDLFQTLPADSPGPASSLRAIAAPAPGVSVRRWPVVVDIWLYPFSRSGLLTLGLVYGVPGAMVLAVMGAWWMCKASLISLILLGPVIVVTLLGTSVMALYLIWYVCQCVRDSASGGLRAPDPLESVPGLDDLLGQFWLCVAASACAVLPAGLYGVQPQSDRTECAPGARGICMAHGMVVGVHR